ncbi:MULTISPECIES: phage distal tail protein [unclassified Streptomyces]|uniref:phage distal tail protein n=1 Tax=unclassified Streptomyces TaxID=2593676 RepID=UPI0006AE0CB7|nr:MULTISPECIES: phage tail domain-containing protein [unclassified Streptomyces]
MAPGDLVTLPGHVQFGDLLLGPRTTYGWESLTGWEETPAYDSGSVNRSDAHGAFPGRLLAEPRTITLDGVVIRTEPGRMSTAVRTLSAATALRDDELPLVIKLDGSPPLLSWARCIRRAVPVATGGYAIGVVTGGAMQFEATDPRRYDLIERVAPGRLPSSEPGLGWPLGWPLAFGEPGSTGTLSVTNFGDAETHPLIEFRGPVERPSLTNIDTGDALEYDLPLTAGEVLVVDTRAGTVTLNATASRLYAATARSVPEQTWTLPPGTSTLAFRAAPGSTDPTASVAVRYRSAYW